MPASCDGTREHLLRSKLMRSAVVLRIDETLCVFLPSRHRHGVVEVPYDGTSSLGHVVQSVAQLALRERRVLLSNSARLDALVAKGRQLGRGQIIAAT
jgi:hypothetical protein